MSLLRALAMVTFALLAGCEIPPNYVERPDIDDAFIRSRYKTVCVGLEMKADATRQYATEKLEEITEPIAQECICKHIKKSDGGWDDAIAKGLTGTERDDLAGCFAELVANPDLPKREEAITSLSRIPAPIARKTLATIATSPGKAEERARAAQAIAGDANFHDEQLQLLVDADATVRAAAASGLGGFKDEKTIAALVRAATSDEDGEVRAAALVAARKAGVKEADEMACKAMMEDESASVRRAAIGSFRGTKRSEPIACLKKRAFTVEEDSGVRTQLLEVLKSSPSDEAAAILCDAIPFWMKNYVVTDLPEKLPGTDIIKYQNDRDWERSYECVGKAYRSCPGCSCFARMYTAWWFRELGGSSFIPNCPGYESKAFLEAQGGN